MLIMKPCPGIRVRKIYIPSGARRVPALVLSPEELSAPATGVLWIHGGGYISGMKEMVYISRAVELVKSFGAVVVSPGYRLAPFSPYPAAIDDCYTALVYMKEHAAELGMRQNQLMVGGESAGGGLCAAVCIRARDTGEVNVAFQMPLYPMLDDRDTETSRDNHGRVWNTWKNHFGWRCYLRGTDRETLPRAITTGACGTRGRTTSDGAAICAAPTVRRFRPTPRPPALRTWRGCPRRTPSSAPASRSTPRRWSISVGSRTAVYPRARMFMRRTCTPLT